MDEAAGVGPRRLDAVTFYVVPFTNRLSATAALRTCLQLHLGIRYGMED